MEKNVADMTEREMLEELVLACRALNAALEGLAESPMIQAVMTGGNPLLAAMNRG